MTINITSGSSGWGNYVLYGTKEKPRDSDKVQFLEGDIALGDRLSESNNYEESYYKIVLAFEGKPDDETIKNAYEDFKKEMFVGFDRDEYHIDAVIHKDTDNYHIHARVPKQNLKTDTHLQLYMDKIDRPRKELIQDHISLKYGFNIAREQNREVFKEQSHEHINKWREQHNQKPFDFSNKKGQKEAEQQINSYVSDLIKSELISSQNDVKSTLEELGLTVERFGTDLKKDFSYVTVSNESGKIRVKGDIYKDEFFKHNAKDRTTSIDNNQRIIADRGSIEERAKEVRRELNRANEKRYAKVTKLFSKSRARAEAEHSKTLKMGELESINTSKSVKSNSRSIDRNSNNSRAEERATNDVSKRDFERQERKSLYPVQSKRINVRQTEKNVLLQNRLKEIRNAKLTREAIRRAEESRTAKQSIIQSITRERQAQQSSLQRAKRNTRTVQDRVRDYSKQLQGAIRTFTAKALNTINQVKEKLNFGKLKKDNNLEKLIEKIEARTQESKSDSSNLDKIKELIKKNSLSQKLQEVDNKQELQAPVKKRSYSKSR